MKKPTLLLSSLFTSTLLSASFLLSACASPATPTQSTAPQTLTVMTHDSFEASKEVIKAFEDANNAKVVLLKSGDAGAALNKATLTKDAPLADVLYGVDNTFLSRALGADIFEPYESPLLKPIPAEFKL